MDKRQISTKLTHTLQEVLNMAVWQKVSELEIGKYLGLGKHSDGESKVSGEV
jgi:hypothetical protein